MLYGFVVAGAQIVVDPYAKGLDHGIIFHHLFVIFGKILAVPAKAQLRFNPIGTEHGFGGGTLKSQSCAIA